MTFIPIDPISNKPTMVQIMALRLLPYEGQFYWRICASFSLDELNTRIQMAYNQLQRCGSTFLSFNELVIYIPLINLMITLYYLHTLSPSCFDAVNYSNIWHVYIHSTR